MEVNYLMEEEHNEHFKRGQCFTCHQTRHIAKACPQKKNGRTPVQCQEMENSNEEDEDTKIRHLAENFSFGEQKELHVPISLISKTHLKPVETTAVVDSRAAGTFFSKDFVKQHHICSHTLSKPFWVTTADGSYSKSGAIC
ncbi:hypothetical protein BDR03DRAFT_858994 [Suillus americanus]|nr:hypothetical protein BDR03DRAFT_858994 [Suillus americanus]